MKKPIFSTSATLAATKIYVEPRPFHLRMEGLTKWVGVNAGIVRKDTADERMLAKGYDDKCSSDKPRLADDDAVLELMEEALGSNPVKFTRQRTVKKRVENYPKWLDLAVYISDADPRIFFLDCGIGGGPEVMFVAPGDPSKGDYNIVCRAFNAAKVKDVTLCAACYTVDDKFLLRVKKQLQRAKK